MSIAMRLIFFMNYTISNMILDICEYSLDFI